jgi:peptidoglycan/xylan/chitin deacetylase (PgdA/CDA1 family)
MMIKALISAAATLLPATRSNRLLTLIYHRVRQEPDEMFPGEVTAEQFDWQMALLARHCAPLPLAEAVKLMQQNRLPARAVAVTFDDGYRDNATHALPILQKHGVPATFFVATSFLNGGIMWNDAVIESIRATREEHLDFSDMNVPPAVPGSGAQRGALAESVIGRIKHLAPDVRGERVRTVMARCGTQLPADLMMSDEEVRQLQRGGMQIGAHTETHPILMSLDAEGARGEIARSRATLEKITAAPVTAFAYPNGRPGEDYTQRDRDIVASLGFEYAAATRWGVAGRDTDIFQLPRFTPWDRNPSRFLTRLMLQFRQLV